MAVVRSSRIIFVVIKVIKLYIFLNKIINLLISHYPTILYIYFLINSLDRKIKEILIEIIKYDGEFSY